MKKYKNTRDGSLTLHIYNQEDAVLFRLLAKEFGVSPQRLGQIMIHQIIEENLKIGIKKNEKI